MGGATLQTDAIVGKYRILRELGRGGMGVVYLAEDTSLSREVALKVLIQSLASDKGFVERFRHEAKIVARIVHPNVVRIHNLEPTEAGFVIDMEYVAGGPLSAVGRRCAFTPTFAAHIARDVLDALRVCHGQSVVHRDIKPSNILLDGDGRAKLADFGLATAYASHQESLAGEASSTGFFMGTPRFAPPEAWDGMRPRPDWDLYSLGLVLYEGLTGKSVYDGATPLAVVKQMMSVKLAPSGVAVPQLSREFADLLDALIAHDRDKRPQSAEEALDRLRATPEFMAAEHIDGQTVRASLPPRVQISAEKKRKAKPRRLALLSAVLFVVAALGVGTWALRDHVASPPPGQSTTPDAGARTADEGASPDDASPKVDAPSDTLSIAAFDGHGSEPSELTLAGSFVYFAADDGIHGRELWRIGLEDTDKPERAAEFAKGPPVKSPRHLFGTSEGVYFCAETRETGAEFFKCFGALGEGARIDLMRDIIPGPMGSEPQCVAYRYPSVLFRARTIAEGHELYTSLGTSSHTAIVADLNPGAGASLPEQLPCVSDGDYVFFAAYSEGLLGQQLCRFRFSENSIRVLHDVSEDIAMIGILNGYVFYKQTDDAHGTELWTYNIETGESKLFADLAPGPESFVAVGGRRLGNQLVIIAETREYGRELWITDGAASGTSLLSDICPGPNGSDPYPLMAHGERIFFGASDGVHGRELWTTDGTRDGTFMVVDAYPGSETSNPFNIQPGERYVAFTAIDGSHGEELWLARVESAKGSGLMVEDAYPGPGDSGTHNLVWVSPTRAYATLNAPGRGREMCRVKVNDSDMRATIEHIEIRPG